MKTLSRMAVAAGLFVTFTPALAQQSTPAPAPSYSAGSGANDIAARAAATTGARNMGDYAIDEMNRRSLTDRAQAAVQNASPGRMSRAERVAQLINDGDCTGAYAMAKDEGDRRLASRVADICEIDQ